MDVDRIGQEQRDRCVVACERLVEAIDMLDSCGLQIEATHAQLCLDRVWEQLDVIGGRPRVRRPKLRRVFVPPSDPC